MELWTVTPPEHERPPERTPDPPPSERPVPRGCHPLVFGVVAATIQMAVLLYFMNC